MRRFAVILSTFFLGTFAFLVKVPPILAESRIRTWLEKARGEATLPEVTALPVIAALLKTLVGLAGVAFLIMMMYAGFTWMTAQGNSEKLDQAKASLVNSTIGLIIVVGAYAITRFVVSTLASILTP